MAACVLVIQNPGRVPAPPARRLQAKFAGRRHGIERGVHFVSIGGFLLVPRTTVVKTPATFGARNNVLRSVIRLL
jgi:hypothetical protein